MLHAATLGATQQQPLNTRAHASTCQLSSCIHSDPPCPPLLSSIRRHAAAAHLPLQDARPHRFSAQRRGPAQHAAAAGPVSRSCYCSGAGQPAPVSSAPQPCAADGGCGVQHGWLPTALCRLSHGLCTVPAPDAAACLLMRRPNQQACGTTPQRPCDDCPGSCSSPTSTACWAPHPGSSLPHYAACPLVCTPQPALHPLHPLGLSLLFACTHSSPT